MLSLFIKSFKIITKEQKTKLIYLLFISFLIPFLEILSIGSVGALVLFVIDLERNIHLIPNFIYKNIVINLSKLEIIYYLGFLIILALCLKNTILVYYYYSESSLRKNISSHHAISTFNKYVNKDYLSHTNLNSADIQNNIIIQSQKCSDFIIFFSGLVKEILILVSLFSTLLLINFSSTILVFSLSLLITLIYIFLTNNKIKKIGNTSKLLESEVIKIIKNTFEGIKIVILFSKIDFFRNQFVKTILKKNNLEVWLSTVQKIPRLFFEFFFILMIIIYIFYVTTKGQDLKSLVPFLIFLSLISIRLVPVIVNINVILTSLKYVEGPVKEYIDELLLKNQIDEKIDFKDKTINNELKQESLRKVNYIGIKNIFFSYPEANKTIIANLSFVLEANKIYAITGKSGSGKSTLMDIIIGISDPSSGSVYVNDLNISDNRKEFYKMVGYVPQDNFLLNDTIVNNVCFGDTNPDIKHFWEAIDQSELDKFVHELPFKENTVIGDRGLKISGGQRQRIGLARALYRNKSILALDEFTSAIDNETEYNILKTLHKIKKEKIIVIIAHKQSTIESCDHIIKLS